MKMNEGTFIHRRRFFSSQKEDKVKIIYTITPF